MAIVVSEITGRNELRKFIFLPAEVNRDRPKWLPPIYMDEWRYFDPKRNRAFGYSDTTLALAWHDHEPVGRVMGIINRRCNEINHELCARWGFLESIRNQEAVHALLQYVEGWARAKGMNKIVGPMGFTDQDPEGFLIEGFEHEPTLQTYYNPEWLVRMVEAEGYVKEIDYVVYLVKVPDELPPLYEKVSARLIRQQEFRLIEFANRKELKPFIRKVFGLMNETYGHLYGYVPMEDKEMDELAAQYLPIVDPRFIKVVTKADKVVAFVIGIPNMNEGLRKSKGHLFPFGILQILASAKKSSQLDLFLGAIRQDCRGRGLDVLMGTAMMHAAKKAGFVQMDSHPEMENNLSVRAEMERVSGKVYKRHRIFQKAL
jgi:hypothetical protein